jgi:hypothetical protein
MDDSNGDHFDVGMIHEAFRRLVEANLDAIGQGLVQKASEGNYNAAHLLLELSGVGPSTSKKKDASSPSGLPRMFLIELVEKVLGRRLEQQECDDWNKTS